MSLEAEQAVLCAILLDSNALEIALTEGLSSKDFLVIQNRLIFEAMLSIDKRDDAIDLISITHYLESKNSINEVGGRDYLTKLSNTFSTIENTASYSRLIIEDSRKYKLRTISASIEVMNSEGATSEEIEIEVNSLLASMENDLGSKTSFTLGESVRDFVSGLQQRAEGESVSYPSGLTNLDKNLNIEAGRLYIIAARPAMGKSTLAQNIAETTAKSGISTLFFSLEMPRQEIAGRIVASQATVDRKFFKDPTSKGASEMWSTVGGALVAMDSWPLEIENKSSLTINDVKIKASQFFRKSDSYTKDGRGMIVIDYLGLMKITNQSRVQGLGEVTKGLKQLAMKMNIPIILLHQLNRGVESRPVTDRRPYMSDLRDSGEIEEDADGILFIYRDEVYNEDSEDKGVAEIIIRKNRDGELGVVRVKSELKYSRFSDLFQSNYND